MSVPPVWLAPAKLNLFLHVTGRRADGYHCLQTLFQFLDIADRLSFEVSDSPDISRGALGAAATVFFEDDLCVRAARLLQHEAGVKKGVRILLEKNLPVGGGLGGGSSDAATTLIALNRLWGLDLPRSDLIELGLRLGADVPVFIYGRSAVATGVGEQFQHFQPPEIWYVVVVPPVEVSTSEIFMDSALTRDTPVSTIRGSLPPGHKNDLEPVTCRLYPEVKDALNWLNSFGEARMSGSGASVFLGVDSKRSGEQVLSQCPPGCRGFIAKGINRHFHAAD